MRIHSLLALPFLTVPFIASCNSCGTSKLSTSSAPIVTTSDPIIIGPRQVGPSAVVSVDLHVVGYTDRRTGHTPMGWAFGSEQPDADGGFGSINFTTCNADDPFCGGVACNGVCMAAPQKAWMGDASLVSDGKGNVVYFTLGDGDGNTANGAELVIATLSTDGGTHFGVNPTDTVVVNVGNCNDGIQDLPDAAIDFTTEPPTMWAAFRHKGQSSFGGCVARGTVVSGVLSFDTPKSINGMDRENGGSTSMGQGGLRVQAGDGAVSVMFTNNDQLDTPPSCKKIGMGFSTVTSLNNGQDWTERALVFHADKFPSCVLEKSVMNSLRSFDFVRATDGNYYAAVQDEEDSIRMFYTPHVGVRPPSLGGPPQATTWRELCPTNPPSPPRSDWLQAGEKCKQAAFGALLGKTILYPTLSADGNSRVSLFYYESTKNEDQLFPTYRGFAAPRLASVIVNTRILDTPNPPTFDDAGVITPYLTMSAGATMRPIVGRNSCVLEEPFFPFWIFPDGLKTRRVVLTGP